MTHSSTFKRAILIVAAIAFLFISSIDLRAQTTYKRGVLIEEVTGQWCGYCPLGAWYMDSLHKYLPDNAVIISWHNQDDMESQDSKTFHKNFGVSSWPGAFFNRYYLNGFGEVVDPATGFSEVQFSSSFGLCRQAIDSAKKAPQVDFRMVNITYSAANRTIDFDLDVTPVNLANLPSESAAQYMVLAVFTEDGITAYQHDYGLDGNANPSDIDPFTHNDVGRKSITNVAGDAITLGLNVPGTALPVRKHYSAPLGAVWNADKIKVKVALFAAAPKNKTPQTDYVFDASMTKQYVTAYPEQAPAAAWIVLPNSNSTVKPNVPTDIVWATGGNTSGNVKLEYSLDGNTWSTIVASTNKSPYAWTIPTAAYGGTAMVRVSDAGNAGTNGISQSFKTPGIITISKPAAGEVINGGTADYMITYNGGNLKSDMKYEYSLDNGATWTVIGYLGNADSKTYDWTTVVNPPADAPQSLIRISDANGVTATSAAFTIKHVAGAKGTITNVVINGLDGNHHIDNNRTLGVGWTLPSGNIGSGIDIYFSDDNGYTWQKEASASVADGQLLSQFKTPATGYHPNCTVKVQSSSDATINATWGGDNGVTNFIVGTAAGVYTNATNGYSISNYPNPFGGSTTIKFELPVRSFVTIRIQDELGREIDKLVTETLDAGVHSVPYNAANISNGVYTYTLEAGTTKLVGKMSVVK